MKSMKVWRTFIAHLSVVLLMTTGSVAARTAPAAQEASGEITAEEKQEAREVVERFIRRMQETQDLTPLIGEMFVSDYAERLHREALNTSLFLVSKSVAQQASREELTRYHVALNNSAYLLGLLIGAFEAAQVTAGDEQQDEKRLMDALPPDLLQLIEDDSILKSVFEDDEKEGGGERESGEPSNTPDGGEDADEPIRSVEQLRNFTSTLEKATVLARRHLGASPVKPTYLERHKGANEDENWEAERDWMRPRAGLLTKEFYGYPKETRLLCVNALNYHMDLIRVDGKLKILALHPNTD
jgi:hypothetical protein